MEDTVSFSFAAFGIYGSENILAQAIGFATMAGLVTRDPFWNDVVDMFKAKLAGGSVKLPAEAMPAETDPPAEPVQAKKTRTPRKPAKPADEEPVAPQDTPPAQEGPSLQDALEAVVKGEIVTQPEEPPAAEPPFEVSRDELLAQCRTRATQDKEKGPMWLREHVMCGDKYPRLSEVPSEVLVRALAV